jgi:hypothetical protein
MIQRRMVASPRRKTNDEGRTVAMIPLPAILRHSPFVSPGLGAKADEAPLSQPTPPGCCFLTQLVPHLNCTSNGGTLE